MSFQQVKTRSKKKLSRISPIFRMVVMLYLYHVNSLSYLKLQDHVVIGRANGDLIYKDDDRMSGKHANISLGEVNNEKVIFVEDLGSKNGTIVNRVRVIPHHKVMFEVLSLLEIGDQMFLVTPTNNLNIQEKNDIIDRMLKKEVINFADQKPVEKTPAPTPKQTEATRVKDTLLQKEAMLVTAQNKLVEVEKVIAESVAKKLEISNQIVTLTSEVEEAKKEAQRVRNEIEMQKKKIIDLNKIPND